MGSSAKFQDDDRAPYWALHGHGNKRIDERPISMMMAELPLWLSMILGRKAAPLAHLVKKNRRAADLHDDDRAPWALHDLGLEGCARSVAHLGFTCYFQRHSEAEWMLRTHLA